MQERSDRDQHQDNVEGKTPRTLILDKLTEKLYPDVPIEIRSQIKDKVSEITQLKDFTFQVYDRHAKSSVQSIITAP